MTKADRHETNDGAGPFAGDRASDLMERARAARELAYAPYSGFAVGAALLDADGGVHVGVNVENASFGLTICAERVALFRAIAEGARSFRAIAIAGPREDIACHPCGACRQVLHEFAPDLDIVVADPTGAPAVLSLDTLLPHAFGPAGLVAGAGLAGDSRMGLESESADPRPAAESSSAEAPSADPRPLAYPPQDKPG